MSLSAFDDRGDSSPIREGSGDRRRFRRIQSDGVRQPRPRELLSKLTVVVAAVFGDSLTLAILAKQRNFSSTVIDMQPKSEPTAPPAVPPAQSSEDSHPSGETPAAGH